MKNCIKCKLPLPMVQFSKNKSKKDGLQDNCKDCDKGYYADNQEVKITYQKDYRQSHKEEIAITQRTYHKSHKEEIAIKKASYDKERRRLDLQFKLTKNLRTRLGGAIKRNQKTGSAISDLGCSIEELKKHLETKFYPNPVTGETMNWNNYGFYGWHIDHIKPLASFDLSNREELLKACHYTNLQPLWAEENFSKGDDESQEPFHYLYN